LLGCAWRRQQVLVAAQRIKANYDRERQ